MSKLTRLVQSLLVLLGTVTALIVGWVLLQFIREQEETEEATRIAAQFPGEINIPLPPQALADEIDITSALPVTLADDSREATGSQRDDLTRIDGVGPRYADGLRDLGIDSFASLSQQEPNDLANRLKELGLRISGDRIRQEDWIGQAAQLAAES